MLNAMIKVLRDNINRSNRIFKFYLDFNRDNCVEIYSNENHIHIMEHKNYIVVEKPYMTSIIDLNEIVFFVFVIL